MVKTPVVAIAGANGFVGKALIQALSANYPVVALGRSMDEKTHAEDQLPAVGKVTKRKCDLFSLLEVEQALTGVEIAYYLVHSMIPSAKLTQGNFVDMDLILADNFSRAAEKAGVRQIIYLTGLLPPNSPDLSEHLQSRWEVEQTLAAHHVPVTALRAGLIVGAGGSSFDMLIRLVQRLPAMLLPRWTATMTHPIDLEDVINLLKYCLDRKETFRHVFEIGGPDIMSYKDMLSKTAEALGVKRRFFPVPILSPRLSRLWIRLITGLPLALISPLVESLRHPMIATTRNLQEKIGQPGIPFIESVRKAVILEKDEPEKQYKKRPPLVDKDVRSVQRLTLPASKDARWVGKFYAQWLPEFFHSLIRVNVDHDGNCDFYGWGIKKPLLVLSYSHERSTKDRSLFYIDGGLLVKPHPHHRGRLEFRQVLNDKCVLVAIHDFSPTLPWYIYNATQALLHLWVMKQFGKHLKYLDTLISEQQAVTSR